MCTCVFQDEDDEEDMEVHQSRLAPEETELQHFIAHVEVPSQKQVTGHICIL